jgi:hypothetical protein
MNIANKASLKQGKYILAAIAIAGALNLSFAEDMKSGVPAGWVSSGALGDHFDIGIDPGESTRGHPALFIASKDAAKGKFAAMSQTIDVTAWQGKAVRFSMMAKVQEQGNYGEVFLRGTAGMSGNDYSSVHSTNIQGVEWKEIALNMVIPKQITQLEFGIGLRQQGKMWVRDMKLVQLEAPPKTERPKHNNIIDLMPLRVPSAAPANLDFSE